MTQNCTSCGKKSECQCDRCGDFYCSEDCQRKDWPKHRFICLPMPKLVKVGKILGCKNPLPQLAVKDAKTPRIPNGSCVVLTGFKSSNRCFIRQTNPSTVAENEKVLNDINEIGKKSLALCGKPKNNSYALALRNEKWCRVQILGNHKDNSYRVSFIDFGDISKRSLNDLRKIESSLVKLPCFIRLVQLKGVTNISTQQKLLKALAQYTNKEYKVEFFKEEKGNTNPNVELTQWGSSILLNSLVQDISNEHNEKDSDIDHLSVASSSSNIEEHTNEGSLKKGNEMEASTSVNGNANKIQKTLKGSTNGTTSEGETKTTASKMNPLIRKKEKTTGENGLVAVNPENKRNTVAPRQIQMQKPCLFPPFDIIPLNENDASNKIMIMDCSYIESGFIGCMLEKYFENLKEISKFLKEYDVGEQPYKPKFDEYCLANFENEWYRAKVVEALSENKFLVVYIDFTNEMELSSESIRHYPMSLTLPCYTSLCAIDGLPDDISDQQKNFLYSNCVPFTPLNIESIRLKGGIPYVKSNELLKKMRDAKLL